MHILFMKKRPECEKILFAFCILACCNKSIHMTLYCSIYKSLTLFTYNKKTTNCSHYSLHYQTGDEISRHRLLTSKPNAKAENTIFIPHVSVAVTIPTNGIPLNFASE